MKYVEINSWRIPLYVEYQSLRSLLKQLARQMIYYDFMPDGDGDEPLITDEEIEKRTKKYIRGEWFYINSKEIDKWEHDRNYNNVTDASDPRIPLDLDVPRIWTGGEVVYSEWVQKRSDALARVVAKAKLKENLSHSGEHI